MQGLVSRRRNGKKYLWDGATFEGEEQASAAAERYRSVGFEAIVTEEGGVYCVFTRRVVAEVKVEGVPPL